MASSDFNRGRKMGSLEGEQRTRSLVLDHLQKLYFDPALKVDSPKGEAILEVTRELAELLRNTPHGQ